MYQRIWFLTTIFFSFSLFASFCPKPEEGILVNITNLRNNNGHVLVSLFKEGVGYPDHPGNAFKKEKLSINNGIATVAFSGVPAGTYAIAVLHDENDDGKMNKNFIGNPKEGYGFSNNVRGAFGPPSYSKASFRYGNNAIYRVEIRVRY